MSIIDTIKAPIKEELKQFDQTFRQAIHSDIKLLNIVIHFIIRRKGKQMRPILVFLSAKLTGEITPSTYIAASMIEMLHTASLIHDDVVDESYERRNYFSINALWKSKMAVLIGDYLLAQGLLISVKNNAYDILRIVSDAVREMSEGEILQMEQSRKLSITEEKYFDIIRRKTATLIKACAASGARSVNASDDDMEKMAQYGEKLGIAFQIQDDLLDYNLESKAGKPSGNDIKEKKITLPLIHSLQKANPLETKSILSLVNKGKANAKALHEITQFIVSKGGFEYSIHKMNEYRDAAIRILDSFPDSDAKRSLRNFALFTTNRTK